MAVLLLQTKLYPPPARADRIARPRLIARLDAGIRRGCKLTLLCAPAGAGKTTLVSQWLASRNEELRVKSEELIQTGSTFNSQLLTHNSQPSTLNYGVAWLSLDTADNDPAQFWSYMIAAIETVQPGAGAAAQAALAVPQPPPITAILAQYINELAERAPRTQPIVLILDDYHAIEAPAIHTTLLFLIEHLPPQLHLVIASRADPPLPLARMRVRGDLAELRAADLCFTPDETATFLTDIMDLSLSTADVAALAARTEGWSAGLHLAALALRERTDPGEFIAAFAGSNRFVIDYLLEEVFSRQPHHIQSFLLQTAILDRLCGSLCDAVLGLSADAGRGVQSNAPTTTSAGRGGQLNTPTTATDSFSQRVLDELERRNLFIVPLDDQRQWYRYHHLFAEVLRTRLRSGAMGAEVAGLHRRASSWYARHDLLPEAVQHALALPDAELAADLIEQGGLQLAGRGQGYTVEGWLRALPETLIRARPMLCFIDAIILMNSNQLEAAAARLTDAERCLTAAPDDQRELILGQVMLVRANLARIAGDAPASVAQAEQALPLLPGTQPMLRAVAALIMARAYLMSGDVTPASEQCLREAVAATGDAGNAVAHLTGLVHIGRMQCLQGRLREAGATYAMVRQMLAGVGPLSNQAGAAALAICEGDWLRERNELDTAKHRLAQGIDAAQRPIGIDADFILLGAIALARLRQARGEHAGALAALDLFEQVAHRHPIASVLHAQASAARALLHLLQGDLATAARWAETVDPGDGPLFPHELEHLTVARVRIAQGRAEEALTLLGRLLHAAEASDRLGSVLEILVVQARAFAAQHDHAAALAALTRALALAAPEGYVRVFVDEGAEMAALLTDIARGHTAVAGYAAALLEAYGPHESGVAPTLTRSPAGLDRLVEPLSERELDVLRLIAAGHSNQAIADTLIIAVGTVKKHVNNIYGKLGVQNRTQALLRARELNLLDN